MSGYPQFMRPVRDESGFSLVELGISLIVIGALVVMLLKGQDIIESVRAVQTAKHIKIIDSAFSGFHSNYNALPGDIPNPERYIRGCSGTGSCAGGNGDGIIAAPDSATSWIKQLQLLDLVPKTFTGSYLSTTDDKPLEIRYDSSAEVNAHVFYQGGFRVKALEKIDKSIDDGKPDTGRFRTQTGGCITSGKNEYNIVGNATNCNLVFILKH